MIHPASLIQGRARVHPKEGAAEGVTDDLIRFSVGLETAADIITDLENALAAV